MTGLFILQGHVCSHIWRAWWQARKEERTLWRLIYKIKELFKPDAIGKRKRGCFPWRFAGNGILKTINCWEQSIKYNLRLLHHKVSCNQQSGFLPSLERPRTQLFLSTSFWHSIFVWLILLRKWDSAIWNNQLFSLQFDKLTLFAYYLQSNHTVCRWSLRQIRTLIFVYWWCRHAAYQNTLPGQSRIKL